MIAHVECPCGWSQDVELRDRAPVTINHILAEHARAHLAKGEPYPVPLVTMGADAA